MNFKNIRYLSIFMILFTFNLISNQYISFATENTYTNSEISANAEESKTSSETSEKTNKKSGEVVELGKNNFVLKSGRGNVGMILIGLGVIMLTSVAIYAFTQRKPRYKAEDEERDEEELNESIQEEDYTNEELQYSKVDTSSNKSTLGELGLRFFDDDTFSDYSNSNDYSSDYSKKSTSSYNDSTSSSFDSFSLFDDDYSIDDNYSKSESTSSSSYDSFSFFDDFDLSSMYDED